MYEEVNSTSHMQNIMKRNFTIHVILVKVQDDMLSLEKIYKAIHVRNRVFFEAKFQDIIFKVLVRNDEISEFSLIDLPLMNVNDLLTPLKNI